MQVYLKTLHFCYIKLLELQGLFKGGSYRRKYGNQIKNRMYFLMIKYVFCFNYLFRSCTEAQTIFKEISSKVTQKAIDGAIKIITRTYLYCVSHDAWDVSNSIYFNGCTMEIASSDPQILAAINNIEKIAQHNQYSASAIWLLYEEIDFYQEDHASKSLEVAVDAINEIAGNLQSTSFCQENCLKTMREIVVQLKLIQWGYYGNAEATAGIYLAFHRNYAGSYFENSLKNYWPYYPLNDEPTELEVRLNKLLVKMTDAMSDGRLKRTSILDLSAYGSPLSNLDPFQTNEANWPYEVNFAIHNKNDTNFTLAFDVVKKLSYHWGQYMDHINEEGTYSDLKFPPNKIENPFNFSTYIFDDLSMFLKVYTGSFPTALEDSHSTWKETAESVFNETMEMEFVKRNGLYDKLIMDCSFQEKLMKRSSKDTELFGGCEYFHHSLTSNGVCYSFNGLRPSLSWNFSKVIEVFEENFEANDLEYRFGGTGASRGINLIY